MFIPSGIPVNFIPILYPFLNMKMRFIMWRIIIDIKPYFLVTTHNNEIVGRILEYSVRLSTKIILDGLGRPADS